MQAELEVKFLNVNHADIRAKLEALGARLVQPRRLMRRRVFGSADGSLEARQAWVRVRDEGNKVTMSYKQQDDLQIDGVKEVNIEVSDFSNACKLLTAIGLMAKSYQETYRESWALGDAEIELEEWPWIQPFIEIEAPTEASLRATAQALGLAWADALPGSIEVAYKSEYDDEAAAVNTWPEITFGPVPEWLETKRKSN